MSPLECRPSFWNRVEAVFLAAMPNKHFSGSQRLLADPDPDKLELEEALKNDDLYMLDLKLDLSGEPIRSEAQLSYKMNSLFKGICIRDATVINFEDNIFHQIVVDKPNFLVLIRHKNYGDQDGDCVVINDFVVYGADDDDENVLKKIQTSTSIDGLDKEITVTIRRGNDPMDSPARGLATYNLMAEQKTVIRILKHFKIDDKITRVTKCTPARPFLSIGLTEPLLLDDQYKHPCLIFDPEPSETNSSQLWAHLHSTREDQPKRMVIEGIYGVVDLKEVEHRLNYQGDILSNLEPLTWNEDGEDCLSGIPNGNIKLDINLKYEINFIMFGKDAFRVSYPGQAQCCSVCFSWHHRASECDRKQEGRDKLRREYLQKWKKIVNFSERSSEDPSVNLAVNPVNNANPAVDPVNNDNNIAEERSSEDLRANPAANPANNDNNTSDENLDNVESASEPIQLNLSSPGDILDKFEKVYEEIEARMEAGAEKLDNDDDEKPENAADTDDCDDSEKDHSPNREPEDEGWMQVKTKKHKAGRRSPASLSSSPASTDDERQTTKDSLVKGNKRKSDSPREKSIKQTGSGRKIGSYAQKTKDDFLAEISKLNFDSIGDSRVKREKFKRNLNGIEQKFYKIMFENESGAADPDANEYWDEIKNTLEGKRKIVEKA